MREMKVSFTRFPVDLVLCLVGSAILVPLALFDLENPVRLILGVPFMLFIPGYVLVSALFPFIKQQGNVSLSERIGLSLVASVAIVPLLGLALNYSPLGIRLQPMLLLVSVFIFGVGSVALYRWYVTSPDKRFILTFNGSLPIFRNKFDKIITMVLGIFIVTAIVLTVYVIVVPKVGEKFTEFYVLDSNGSAYQYPQNLSIGENVSVILGISNHEYQDITYTVQAWLVNQTTFYDTSEQKNETIINHMWLMYENRVKLNHTSVDLDPQGPQWENTTTFSVNHKGFFKLVFLLFTTPTGHYVLDEDYRERADELIKGAYRELHLWVTIT
jgi:uncharacterized membrane protein